MIRRPLIRDVESNHTSGIIRSTLTTIMSGMSKSFKFPGIIKERKAVSHGLPTFDLGKVTNLRKLGLSSFGSIHLGDYVCGVEIQSVVVKKLRGESEDAKRRFVKEAKLLNGMKHPNIPSFLGFFDVPYALMMEHVAFDFAPFGLQKTLYNLEDLTVSSTLKCLMMSLQSVCEIS